MSTTIDQRIIEMQLDNRNFETNAKNSMNTLSNLNNSLNLKSGVAGFESLNSAIRNTDISGFGGAVESVTAKFSALQVMGVTALMNITNSAINTGKRLVSSLTIDPISDGYADYNRKLTSVQTIMNATGKGIDVVNGYFSELDEYADKTIYNLDDMTSAFAKFTNAGVDMEKSVPAIKGIANMTALAGQDSRAAQIAMYNLSQSIAGGFLTTMDYKSLNLANIATSEWKDNMIKAAIAAGTVKKEANGMYSAMGSKAVYNKNELFSEGLTKAQWATTDIMLKVLGDYGDVNTKIGKKAQSAAQDVKSYGMMMETLKSSVGTGWTDTFEIIIGDLNESKKLFTALTNTLDGILKSITNARNNLLKGWKDLGGRNDLIDSFKNIYEGFRSIINPLREVFKEIFPPMTAEKLANMTKSFKEFTSHLKLNDETTGRLKRTFKGFLSVISMVNTLYCSKEITSTFFNLFSSDVFPSTTDV